MSQESLPFSIASSVQHHPQRNDHTHYFLSCRRQILADRHHRLSSEYLHHHLGTSKPPEFCRLPTKRYIFFFFREHVTSSCFPRVVFHAKTSLFISYCYTYRSKFSLYHKVEFETFTTGCSFTSFSAIQSPSHVLLPRASHFFCTRTLVFFPYAYHTNTYVRLHI